MRHYPQKQAGLISLPDARPATSRHAGTSEHAQRWHAWLLLLILEGKLSLLLASEDSGLWQQEQICGGGSGVVGAWQWQKQVGNGEAEARPTASVHTHVPSWPVLDLGLRLKS